MKTVKIKSDFFKGFREDSGYIEVFVNPTLSEIKAAGNEIRFTADNHTKRVYVWNSWAITHDRMKRMNVGFEPKWDEIGNMNGRAVRKGDKFVVPLDGLDWLYMSYAEKEVDKEFVLAQAKINWKWLHKYYIYGIERAIAEITEYY